MFRSLWGQYFNKNENEVSLLSLEYNYNYVNNIKADLVDIDCVKVLYNICQKYSNKLIISELDINSLRNMFAWLSAMIKEYIDLLLLSETKIDSSFPTAQFRIDDYIIYRHDRDEKGGGYYVMLEKMFQPPFWKLI